MLYILLRFVTVVFNDELHNFDEVIQQFKELMGSSQSEGSKYATSIDREGRMLLRKNTERDAIELRDKFLSYKPKNTSSRHTFNQQPLVVSNSETELLYRCLLSGDAYFLY